MATALLAALKLRGLFDGRVLTTCWIAGAALEAVYALGRVSTDGTAADTGADSLCACAWPRACVLMSLWLCRALVHESLWLSIMDRHDG